MPWEISLRRATEPARPPARSRDFPESALPPRSERTILHETKKKRGGRGLREVDSTRADFEDYAAPCRFPHEAELSKFFVRHDSRVHH